MKGKHMTNVNPDVQQNHQKDGRFFIPVITFPWDWTSVYSNFTSTDLFEVS